MSKLETPNETEDFTDALSDEALDRIDAAGARSSVYTVSNVDPGCFRRDLTD